MGFWDHGLLSIVVHMNIQNLLLSIKSRWLIIQGKVFLILRKKSQTNKSQDNENTSLPQSCIVATGIRIEWTASSEQTHAGQIVAVRINCRKILQILLKSMVHKIIVCELLKQVWSKRCGLHNVERNVHQRVQKSDHCKNGELFQLIGIIGEDVSHNSKL